MNMEQMKIEEIKKQIALIKQDIKNKRYVIEDLLYQLYGDNEEDLME